mmetsp:Transcript_9701/g.14365  ORF Transcript_9701/g.14365 Transcript_9701/m.14365 type:complete len:117 (-) Transcript_9701:12-362(-)
MLCEYGSEGAETTGSFNISNNSNNNHGGSLKDGNGINNLTLVHKGTGTVDSTDDVGHTGLVTTEGGEVRGGGSVLILGEGAAATMVVLGALLGKEPKVSVPGGLKLTVRHRFLGRR